MSERHRYALTKYHAIDDMKDDDYLYWQRQSSEARMKAVAELTIAAYRLNDKPPHARRLQRTLVRVQRT